MTSEFEEIVVEYLPEDLCAYPEYKGKPYFSIKYKEGNDHFIGYGTYKPEVFSRFLRDYFMPSVTPTYRDRTVQDFADKCRECGKQKWIPCSDKLPKPNDYDVDKVCKYYLIQNKYGDMYVAHYTKKGWNLIGSYLALGDSMVVAWMPLPEPYKAETEREE